MTIDVSSGWRWPSLFAHSAQALAQVPGWIWALGYFSWLLAAIVFIVLQRRHPSATLAWIIGFLSLPLVGALVYFFFGPRKLQRRRLRRALAKELAAQSVPVARSELAPAFVSENDLAPVAQVTMSRAEAGPVRASRVELLIDGDQTYATIEKAMSQAKQQIHLEYYIFEPDVIGQRWRDLLTRCARRGITVRILLDAIGSKNCTKSFWAPVIEAGAEVRYFNPARIFKPKPGKLNFRSHRKIVIIDGSIGYTGGINVSAENSQAARGANAWRDTHIRIDGPPVRDLQLVFLEDWLYANEVDSPWANHSRADIHTPADARQWFPAMPKATGPWVQIIDSGPDEEMPDIHHFFFTAIAQARQRVWINTPYFVPDEAMLTALITASARGVDVRLMIPHEGDSKLVTAAASTYADEVAAGGTQVLSYGPQMNHAKTMVIDDELAVVGTANMDNRSFRLNFEVIAAVFDRSVNRQLAEVFEKDIDSSRILVPGQNDGNFFNRLIASGARLFAPLL